MRPRLSEDEARSWTGSTPRNSKTTRPISVSRRAAAGSAAWSPSGSGQTRIFDRPAELARDTGDALGYSPAPVSLADVLVAAARRNWPAAECCGVTLVAMTRPTPQILADGRLLVEAVDRLILDAISSAEPAALILCELEAWGADATITVRTRLRARSCGLIQRALHPFRLDDRQSMLGTPDLDLWVTRLIAERHRGRVELCDVIGAACSGIRLVLPLLAAP